MRLAASLAVVLVVHVTRASANPEQAGPPPPDLRTVAPLTAPHDLGTVTLPATFPDLVSLFERLPPDVAGHPRSPRFDRITPERSNVGFGEDKPTAGGLPASVMWIVVVNVKPSGFFPPEWTGAEVVALMATSDTVRDAGRDGDLVWMHQVTFAEPPGAVERSPIYGMVWGRADSQWLFSVQAYTPEHRDLLLAAFVAAARPSIRR